MFSRTLKTMAVAVTLALAAPFAVAGNGPGTPATTPYVAPTAAEAVDLTYMREEEKLARDVYLTLGETWTVAPFENIAGSEQRHMDAVLKLLVKYLLPDPAAGNAIGEFTDPTLQALYVALVQKGQGSVVEALLVGGLIEETDLTDLAAAMSRTTKADILKVYTDLSCGSRNHLRAFAGQYSLVTDAPYAAQSLPQSVVDGILAQPMERCGNGRVR